MKKRFIEHQEVSFLKKFPQVVSLKLNGKESGAFSNLNMIPQEAKSLVYFDESSISAKIPCSNPRCQQGGYPLEAMLDSIIGMCTEEHQGYIRCNGHEGTPKGGRIGNSCDNSIKFTITVNYKPL